MGEKIKVKYRHGLICLSHCGEDVTVAGQRSLEFGFRNKKANVWDIEGSLNPMEINHSEQVHRVKKKGPDLVLRRFMTYRLAAESGGKPGWCY